MASKRDESSQRKKVTLNKIIFFLPRRWAFEPPQPMMGFKASERKFLRNRSQLIRIYFSLRNSRLVARNETSKLHVSKGNLSLRRFHHDVTSRSLAFINNEKSKVDWYELLCFASPTDSHGLPRCNVRPSMCDIVPGDWVVQRAYL